jgi:hypothetical protein
LENKTLVGALKFIEKEKKWNEKKKAGFFCLSSHTGVTWARSAGRGSITSLGLRSGSEFRLGSTIEIHKVHRSDSPKRERDGSWELCLFDTPPRALWIFCSVILRAAAASAARHHGKHSLHLFLALPQCSCSVFAEKLEEKQVEEEWE